MKKKMWTKNKRSKREPLANRLYSMIETKEAQHKTLANVALAHNNVTVVNSSAGGALNPFSIGQGVQDGMGTGTNTNRVGDKITVKGLLIRAFFENALERAKVYYRVMFIRCAKGDTITRATLFKECADNKMIDQVNTERYTILGQRIFNVSASNNMAATLVLPPIGNGVPATGTPAGIATRPFKMWIPGRKFGKGGNMQFENGSVQIKFFDYRVVIVVYDWFGTPQDINNVGRINELYTKLYFKDA